MQQLIESDSIPMNTSVVIPVKHKVNQQHIVIFTPLEPSDLPELLSCPEQLQRIDFIALLNTPIDQCLDTIPIPVIEVTVREGPVANPNLTPPKQCEIDLVNRCIQPLLSCLNQVIVNP